jgi:hypothetical protein
VEEASHWETSTSLVFCPVPGTIEAKTLINVSEQFVENPRLEMSDLGI